VPDFGHRDGFSTLGSYKVTGGLSFIYAPTGDSENPTAGTVEAWIAAGKPWTNVRMVTAYEPVFVSRFPVRTAIGGSVACAFPSIEADAIVAAGIATYA
jgi:hypothetical protein